MHEEKERNLILNENRKNSFTNLNRSTLNNFERRENVFKNHQAKILIFSFTEMQKNINKTYERKLKRKHPKNNFTTNVLMKMNSKEEKIKTKQKKISIYLILYKMNTKENKYTGNLLSYISRNRFVFFF